MKRSLIQAALLGATVVSAASIAQTQGTRPSKVDFGALEYKSSCGACHGEKGKGDGPLRVYLTLKAPTDLTTLAKRNGNVFPIQRIYDMIDGRQLEPAHGSHDMPIWGTHYLKDADRVFEPPADREVYVRNRIIWLMDYLNRIQVK